MKGRVIGALWIIGALFVCYFEFGGEYFNLLFVFCFLMSMAEIMIISETQKWRMDPLSCQPAGAWAFEVCVLMFATIAALIVTREELAFVVLVSTLADVGAFAVGKLFGKHRAEIFYRISPKKTYEGFIGGIMASFAALFFCPLFGITITTRLVIFMIFAGVVAEAGDLLGSASKRQLGIKDSGDGLMTIPVVRLLEYPLRGHGGYLDRMDSISLTLMFFALVMVS